MPDGEPVDRLRDRLFGFSYASTRSNVILPWSLILA
jgi:hypothetical protein